MENKPLTDIQRLVYFTGERKTQIVLSQMRMDFCDLNGQLYNKLCVASPLCSCGDHIESPLHFFRSCRNYSAQRTLFLMSIHSTFGNVQIPALEHILHGDPNMSLELNVKLCHLIHSFVKNTNRFK